MATDDPAESGSETPERVSAQPASLDYEWQDEDPEADDAIGPPDAGIDDRELMQALGWFSIGLGVIELLAPRAVDRAIGVGDHPVVTRMVGVREIVSGVGLLSERQPGWWAWARAAGDAMDLALLGAAARSPDSDPSRIAFAATSVLGRQPSTSVGHSG